uniref:Uncharacterized protein n=1 Tax=Arundo donax TaxID=35708 RepID=A0A0A9DE28_ARUDO
MAQLFVSTTPNQHQPDAARTHLILSAELTGTQAAEGSVGIPPRRSWHSCFMYSIAHRLSPAGFQVFSIQPCRTHEYSMASARVTVLIAICAQSVAADSSSGK